MKVLRTHDGKVVRVESETYTFVVAAVEVGMTSAEIEEIFTKCGYTETEAREIVGAIVEESSRK